MLFRNIFLKGKQNKSTDKSLVPQDEYFNALNLRFHDTDGNDGIGTNIKGTELISDVTDGNSDLKCVGAYFNEDKDVIYYKLASSDGIISIDAEYNIKTDITTIVLKDTNGVLRYNKKGYITGWNEIDGIQIWSEWGNNPRRINTERAKTYGTNGFTEDDITLIVNPPLQKLRITLEDSDTAVLKENNIEEKFISFSYRYRYLDGEYSTLAPFTNFAFFPKKFDYDYSEQSNRSMINKFNQVKIEFNTGNERVTEIQLVFKESTSNETWIIDDFNKRLLNYGDNQIESFSFNNLKSKRALLESVVRSFFDAVPITNKAQTMISGRLFLSNYIENFDIVDDNGNEISLDYYLSLIKEDNIVLISDGEGGTIEVPSLNPVKTIKSNRDYEVKLSYGFKHGRITTLLSSKTNTIFVPSENCVNKNSIKVTLKHKPPKNATHYKFFIRQNKKYYDQILPTLFYEDGVFVWVKLEGADKDKIKENDYLIVKADSSGLKTTLTKTKVLEVKRQERNFLTPDASDTKERSGLYFKIKPKGYRIDIDDFLHYHLKTYHNSRKAYNDPLTNQTAVVGDAHFYGSGLDDMTSSGTCTLANDVKKRYLIEIDGTGATDTFKWSDDNGQNWAGQNIQITGNAQTLNNGVEVTFNAVTGHTIGDKWNINARGKVENWDSRAYGFFRLWGDKYNTMTDADETKDNEIVEAGARIRLEYDEYGRGDTYFVIDAISSTRYDNIEEWFYKDNIRQQMISQGYTADTFWFVRGVIKKDKDGNANYLDQNSDGYITMVLRSQEHDVQVGVNNLVKIVTISDLFQNKNIYPIVFETEPKDQPKEIFHEIGKTYKIVNNFHTKDSMFETDIPINNTDVSQDNTHDLEVTLDWFNSFSFGNTVESFKIKDDFNANHLENGIRTLASTKDKYKQVHRVSDVTWSDVYNDENDFNGLNSFNTSLLNFITLDKEEGSVQKLHNANKNLLIYQEDAIGIVPYNKNIIYGADGGKTIGISTNILDEKAYQPYDSSVHGISLNPESFVSVGNRKYSVDRVRGDFLRLSIDGITEINKYNFEHWFSNELNKNKGQNIITGYDPKHKEILLYLPLTGLLAFKESAKGFPAFYPYEPDFMLGANNELYSWKNGKMYIHNKSVIRNYFYGVQYNSSIKFFVNKDFAIDKVFSAIKLFANKPARVILDTGLTSRVIEKEHFTRKESFYFTDIKGNTNGNIDASSIFGLGSYEIINGTITLNNNAPNTLSIGDYIRSSSLLFNPIRVNDIQGNVIVLDSTITTTNSFLMYVKNQNIDGSSIRGNVLEVELIFDNTDKLELKAFEVETKKSFTS